ncbi:MAG: metallophosphoesterase [Alkalispirochaetaceae bacterium]
MSLLEQLPGGLLTDAVVTSCYRYSHGVTILVFPSPVAKGGDYRYPYTVADQSTYIVGDVHGRLDSLEALLEDIRADAEGRNSGFFIVFVGDLVDRGPDSAGVIRRVRELVEQQMAASVLGNHDEMFLQTVSLARPDLLPEGSQSVADLPEAMMLRHWLSQGGRETLESYRQDPSTPASWHFPEGDIPFLEGLPLYWENEQVVVTHALPSREMLFRARKPGGSSDPEVRQELLWRRQEPVESPDPERLHVSGHTPVRNAVFHQSINALQIDTACVFGIALSAYCVETGELLSVAC